jgi:hypothetical protein
MLIVARDKVALETSMTIAWEAKRRSVIKRFLTAWEKYQNGADPAEVKAALDAMTVAHIAASLETEIVSVTEWSSKDVRAIARLAKACRRYIETDENPEAEDRLNIALDEFSVVHVAATSEWVTSLFKAAGARARDIPRRSVRRLPTFHGGQSVNPRSID